MRYRNKIWIISFAIFLVCPTIVFIVFRNHLDMTNYENRVVAPRPVLEQLSLTDIPDVLEAYYNDHLPLRNELIGLKSRIDYYIYKDSPSDRVIIGEDDWLFYTGAAIDTSTGKEMLTDEKLKNIADNLNTVGKYFESHGIEFLVYIAPNKETVYREKLPKYYPITSDVSVGKQLSDYLKENTDINVVWPLNDIVDAKNDHDVYCHLDTHWNNIGAYTGAITAAKALGIDMPELGKMNLAKVCYSRGDLADLMHLRFENRDVDYRIEGYEDEGYPLEQYANEFMEYHSESGDDRIVVMRRDSFGIRLAKFLAPEFRNMYVMTSDSPEETLKMFDADIFVYEIVERNADKIQVNLSYSLDE